MGIATIKELASIEFQGLKDFSSIPKHERLENTDGLIDQIRPIAILAVELLSWDKDELIGKAATDPDIWGSYLAALGATSESLKGLQNIISAAEVRMAVALANVEGVDTA
jgi:hypothetical protein